MDCTLQNWCLNNRICQCQYFHETIHIWILLVRMIPATVSSHLTVIHGQIVENITTQRLSLFHYWKGFHKLACPSGHTKWQRKQQPTSNIKHQTSNIKHQTTTTTTTTNNQQPTTNSKQEKEANQQTNKQTNKRKNTKASKKPIKQSDSLLGNFSASPKLAPKMKSKVPMRLPEMAIINIVPMVWRPALCLRGILGTSMVTIAAMDRNR